MIILKMILLTNNQAFKYLFKKYVKIEGLQIDIF